MTLNKLLALPLLALACTISPPDFRGESPKAMPSKEAIALVTPGGGAAAQSAWLSQTQAAAADFNVPVSAFLDLLLQSVSGNPTGCTLRACTWDPPPAPQGSAFYEVVVTNGGDGFTFNWTFSARPASNPRAPFATVARGVSIPAGPDHHGTGNFAVDFDRLAGFDPAIGGAGQLQVTSYSNAGRARLSATFANARDAQNPGKLVNLALAAAYDGAGGGDLQAALHDAAAAQRYTLHARWNGTGAGRADAQGSAGGSSFQLSDCWGAPPFTDVYFTSTLTQGQPPFGGPASGAASACAYSDTQYSSLTAP